MAIAGIPILDQIPLEDILKTIHQKSGLINRIAEELKISNATFYTLMDKNQEVKTAVEEARRNHIRFLADEDEEHVKLAYASLKSHLQDKDITATIFTLKTKSGYNEKVISDATVTQIFVQSPFEANGQSNPNPT